MSKLDKICEALQEKIDSGELTLETANSVLDKAKAKYTSESCGELREADDITLEEAIVGINALLNEAEELCKEPGTTSTSHDAPHLPENTNTGEGVTGSIDANRKASLKKMLNLAINNERNANADAEGEDDKDTTVNADDLTESVNMLKLRVFEAFDNDLITAEEKDLFLDYLDINNYVSESEENEEEDDSDYVESVLDAYLNDTIDTDDALALLAD